MTNSLEDSFDRCCRLCAEEQDVTIMIFSQEAEAMLLQNKLNRYLLIEVDEDDKLPKNICIQCCTKLQSVCDFIDTARRAQEVLLHRSLMMDQIMPNKCMISLIPNDLKPESEGNNENDKYTEMEVNVDPMMVLQNSEINFSCDQGPPIENITYLHGLDEENVTIKLIKKGETHSDYEDNQKVKGKSSTDDNSDNDEKQDLVKPYPCTTCDRRFCTEIALKNHTWVHNPENKDDKLYKCNTCEEEFNYKYDLISHLKKHRTCGECQLCGRMFRSQRTYVAHMSIHLPSSKSFNCKICGRSYNTWGGLKTHSVTHSSDRPYQCKICMKTFKRNQDLKFHTNQHTGAKPYKCPFCEKSFASSGNCYSHRSRMHPGEQLEGNLSKVIVAETKNENIKAAPILRAIAPKPANLPKPTNLPISANPPKPANLPQVFLKAPEKINNAVPMQYNLTAVNGVIKYQCHLCEHSFMKKENLNHHIYQHTGEKPFKCSYCPDKFVTRRGLLIHHENKHPGKDRPLGLISKNMLLK